MQKEYAVVTLRLKVGPMLQNSSRDEIFAATLAALTPEKLARDVADHIQGDEFFIEDEPGGNEIALYVKGEIEVVSVEEVDE